MAVSLYFGLPGCGKTTLMSAMALKAVKGKKYQNVYCNVRLAIDGVTFVENDQIGLYDLSDGLLLIDEATLFADNRAYKSFPKHQIEYFLLHRHYNVDIVLIAPRGKKSVYSDVGRRGPQNPCHYRPMLLYVQGQTSRQVV